MATEPQWCLVSQAVLEGTAPGFLYRERPLADGDSGWRIFSGKESGEYLAWPDHVPAVPLHKLIQRWPELAERLDGPVGRVWERGQDGWTMLSDQGESSWN